MNGRALCVLTWTQGPLERKSKKKIAAAAAAAAAAAELPLCRFGKKCPILHSVAHCALFQHPVEAKASSSSAGASASKSSKKASSSNTSDNTSKAAGAVPG